MSVCVLFQFYGVSKGVLSSKETDDVFIHISSI